MNSLTYFIENHPKKVRWVRSLGHNLGQIRSNLGKKQRKCYFYGVFFIFCMSYTFTVVVIEIPEWKLKSKLARSTIFKGD